MSGSGCCSTKLGPTMIYMSKRFAEKDMRTERNNVEVVVGGLMMLWLGCLALAIYIEEPKAWFFLFVLFNVYK